MSSKDYVELRLQKEINFILKPQDLVGMEREDLIDFIDGVDGQMCSIDFTMELITKIMSTWGIAGFEALTDEFTSRAKALHTVGEDKAI